MHQYYSKALWFKYIFKVLLFICVPANNSLWGESLIICLVIEYWRYNLFCRVVFILILFLRNKLSLTSRNQTNIRLQYTCWQMAQQYYLFIELISFGKIDCLFVRSYILFLLVNKYFICVHWGRAAQDESMSAFICRSVIISLRPTIAVRSSIDGMCISLSCLLSARPWV